MVRVGLMLTSVLLRRKDVFFDALHHYNYVEVIERRGSFLSLC
jgi:hypothetical protein